MRTSRPSLRGGNSTTAHAASSSGSPAARLAAATASDSPPSWSTRPTDSACVPVYTRPLASARTSAAVFFRPAATCRMGSKAGQWKGGGCMCGG
eukprot:25027-Chlamydomonas_euryale.AAC.1